MLDMSRASYANLEQGKHAVSLREAEKISDIYGISIQELIDGEVQNIQKYKHMIFAFLRADISDDKKVTKTKLAKLLYLADFKRYYDCFKSMSGMQYRKIPYGPVPDMYFRAIDELYEEGKIDIEKKSEGALLICETKSGSFEKLESLDMEERDIIKKIAKKWKNNRTQEIVAFAHGQLPYILCSDGNIIPYELITQENPDHVW